MSKRDYFFRGFFYPESCAEVKLMLDKLNTTLKDAMGEHIKEIDMLSPKALIVPHAGYIYSGFTANIAYLALSKNKKIKKALIIGPSHHHYFEGISLCEHDEYDLRNFTLKSAKNLKDEIKTNFDVIFVPDAHKEHSTETQFPFLAYHLGIEIEILEIVYGRCDSLELEKIIKYAISKEDTAIIISTDLSHFHNEEEANKIDTQCLTGIDTEDLAMLEHSEACGIEGVKALVKIAKDQKLKHKILDYRTSSWASGDKSRVVGYVSVAYF